MANTSALLLKDKRRKKRERDEAEKLRKRQVKILKARKDAGEITKEETELSQKLSSRKIDSTYKQDECGNTGLIAVVVILVLAAIIGAFVLLL